MKTFQQPFKFPKTFWIIASSALFLYLLLVVDIGLPGKFPRDFTVWRAVLDGQIFLGLVFGLLWLVIAVTFGAFIAAVLGILRQLFWK